MHAILVDLDGTIYDSAPGSIGSFQHALRCLGAECPPDEDLTWVVGPPLRRSFPKLIGPDQDVRMPFASIVNTTPRMGCSQAPCTTACTRHLRLFIEMLWKTSSLRWRMKRARATLEQLGCSGYVLI